MEDAPLSTSFGHVIKSRRRLLDLTQQELASQVGYSVITIRKVEADERRPSRQLAERLATCLDIDPHQQPAFMVLARADPEDSAVEALPAWGRPPAPPTNLASPLTRLIGREVETAELRNTLLHNGVRLVTLVGPPGIGKSRLSVQVAAELRHRFPDGVFFLCLAPIADPVLVASSIATVCGVKDVAGQQRGDALVEYLRERKVLLLLDDFEHLLSAAPLVTELLTACPQLTVLATSREALHLRGEQLFHVPPLALADPDRDLTAEAVARSAAVQLFVERAQAVVPAFALDDSNAVDIAGICARLDGLPLAIELVAARVRLLAPAAILPRLTHRLALLTDGPRDLPTRQQALRSTIDWSYNLLDRGEQTLFARLAVFAGGCSLAAAEEITDVDGDLPVSVLDGLAALADKNLLRQEERTDGERYSVFLETIREYALERLLARDEEQVIRARHAAYYLRLAVTASRHLGGEGQQAWLGRLDAEHNNLRAVLEWHVARGAVDDALRLAAALWKFWHIHSRQTEGRRAVDLVLAMPGAADGAVRAQVLYGAGWIALDQCDHESAQAYFDESLAAYRALNDRRGVAEALHGVGAMKHSAGHDAEATALFRESLALYRELDDPEGIAWSLDHLGQAATNRNDHAGAEALFEESLAIFRGLRHAWGSAILIDHVGLAALARSDYVRAGQYFTEALQRFEELNNDWGIATSYGHLGYLALALDDLAAAHRHFTTGLALSRQEHYRDGIVRSLAGLGGVAVVTGDLARAARVFGAVDLLAQTADILVDSVERVRFQRDLAVVRAGFDDEAVARAWQQGRELTIQQVTDWVLSTMV